MKRICVFCGSNPGSQPEYLQAAQNLGTLLAKNHIELVYGGASIGLMGAVSDAVLAANGHVIGVIPKLLMRKEVAHQNLKDLRVVNSMHERKALMAELSDGFIAMPGGFGTFEELCEILTWAQLGLHQKPIGLLNIQDYYASLLALFDNGVKEQFIRPQHRNFVLNSHEPEQLLQKMTDYKPVEVKKWIKSPAET